MVSGIVQRCNGYLRWLNIRQSGEGFRVMKLRRGDLGFCRKGLEYRDLAVLLITIWICRLVHPVMIFIRGLRGLNEGLKDDNH